MHISAQAVKKLVHRKTQNSLCHLRLIVKHIGLPVHSFTCVFDGNELCAAEGKRRKSKICAYMNMPNLGELDLPLVKPSQ